MVIYPVPPAVRNARVQLLIDQVAGEPPATIVNDVGALVEAQKAVEEGMLIDLEV